MDEGGRERLRQIMARRCAMARALCGLTQLELGRRFGKTAAWFGQVEAGKQYPPPYLLLDLVQRTGLSFGWFYGAPEPRDEATVQRLEAARTKGGVKAEIVTLEAGLRDLHVFYGRFRESLPDVHALARELELHGATVAIDASGSLATTRGALLDLAMSLIARDLERGSAGPG